MDISEIMYTVFCCAMLTLIAHRTTGQEDPRLCPPELKELAQSTNCAAIKCLSTLRQRDCNRTGSVLEDNVSVCKCCPGCVKYRKKYNEDPDDNPDEPACIPDYGDLEQYDPDCKERICPIVRQCRRGLECRQDPVDFKYKCLLPEPLPLPDLDPDCPGLCWLKQAVAEVIYWEWEWENACTADGYFKPIQCKGSIYAGDCFCVDKCGQRIFGRARRDKAAGQTCECSRRVHELRASGRISTIHCTEEGNYESLQCDTDSSLCYCMDPETGKLTGEVLPEHEWKNLPCYNSSATNFEDDGRYLRRCESEWAAAQKIAQEAKLHGLEYDQPSLKYNCDYDGSFGQVFADVVDNRDFCSHKDGTQIGPYFRTLNTDMRMDCNCARDIAYYSVHGLQFSRGTCDKSDVVMGNYLGSYITGEYATCVDADGYDFGPKVPSDLACCLQAVVDSTGAYATTCPRETEPKCVEAEILQCALYSTLIREHYAPAV